MHNAEASFAEALIFLQAYLEPSTVFAVTQQGVAFGKEVVQSAAGQQQGAGSQATRTQPLHGSHCAAAALGVDAYLERNRKSPPDLKVRALEGSGSCLDCI
jgi:hypothetical protein